MSEDKLSRAKSATVGAVRERDSANAHARKAIKLILSALAEVIGEESLRGLPNIATSAAPYRAVRVLATKRSNYELPKDGRVVLCINMRGQLVFASYTEFLTVAEKSVGPHEIKSEWAEDVAEAAIFAIDRHLSQCERSEKRYEKINNLSRRLIAALEEQP